MWEFAGRPAHRELDFYLDPHDPDKVACRTQFPARQLIYDTCTPPPPPPARVRTPRPTHTEPSSVSQWYDSTGSCRFKRAVELYHAPEMWENSTSPRMHALFAELHGTRALQAGNGRCSITPPSRDPAEVQGLHWDLTPLYTYQVRRARPDLVIGRST